MINCSRKGLAAVRQVGVISVTSRLLLLLAFCVAGLAERVWAQVPSPAPDPFNPGANAPVHAFALAKVGTNVNPSVLLGGEFTMLGGEPRAHLARVDGSGTLDTNFTAGVDGEVYGEPPYVMALAVQEDGKMIVGGNFLNLAAEPGRCVGRLHPDGSIDRNFVSWADGAVYGLLPQPDGKVLLWGNFMLLSGAARPYVGRLNADGFADENFAPGFNGQVLAVALQPDGKVVVGGLFSMVTGSTIRNGLARFNPDGTLDAAFDPDPGNFAVVSCLALQRDGKILVSGRFSQLGGKSRVDFGRLNADGTLDESFNPLVSGLGAPVVSMALQADGSIVLGGVLTGLGGVLKTNLARLKADGSLDQTFNAATDGAVSALALDPEGNLLVGGEFGVLSGEVRPYVGRLANGTTGSANTDRFSWDGTHLTWVRTGTLPEFWRTSFEWSTNGTDWIALGTGMPGASGWQVTTEAGFQPGAYIRGRGLVAGGRRNGSSYAVEKTQQLTVDTSPVIVVDDGNFGWKADGFGFNVRGLPGQTAVVEGSSDLAAWAPLATNRFTTTLFHFKDSRSAQAQAYFRVRLQ